VSATSPPCSTSEGCNDASILPWGCLEVEPLSGMHTAPACLLARAAWPPGTIEKLRSGAVHCACDAQLTAILALLQVRAGGCRLPSTGLLVRGMQRAAGAHIRSLVRRAPLCQLRPRCQQPEQYGWVNKHASAEDVVCPAGRASAAWHDA
jgi:hypothetical protein